MEILVIGATGFIGAELTAFARHAGHHVLGCGRGGWEEKAASLFPDRADYWSLADGELPGEMLDRADCLVLLAARRPYAGFCFDDYANNVALARRYMALAMDHGLGNFVFASSKAVYSGGDMPWREDRACVPSSLYGASKLASEQLGLLYSAGDMLHFKGLRFAQVIGAGERKGYLINTLMDNARAGKTQTVFGTGEQRRQYVYVKDVCAAILAAAERPELTGVFNIAMPGSVSNLELAEAVNEAFGNDGNLRHDFSRPMVGADDEMDVTRAAEVLHFRASYTIRETFADLAGMAGREHE